MPTAGYAVDDDLPDSSTQALPPAQVGLRREMNLLEQITRSPAGSWRFSIWQADDSLVVPRRLGLLPKFSRACEVMNRSNWPVFVRESGGGVTPLSGGVLNLSVFIKPISREPGPLRIEQGYRFLCGLLVDAAKTMGITNIAVGAVAGAFCDGRYNLTVDGLKVAGTAQRWRRLSASTDGVAVLAHAAIIVDAQVGRLSNVVNHFYSACAIEARCDAQSHSSLNLSLERQGQSRTLTVDDVAAILRDTCGKQSDCIVW